MVVRSTRMIRLCLEDSTIIAFCRLRHLQLSFDDVNRLSVCFSRGPPALVPIFEHTASYFVLLSERIR